VLSWRNAAKLDLALDDATEQVDLVRLANADRALEEKDYHHARFELGRCPETRRGWEWSFLKRRVDAAVPLVLSGVENPIYTSGK